MTRIIGLTAGICSGKSKIASLLRTKYACTVIDADKLGHEAYESGTPCFEYLVQHFGDKIRGTDGQINRSALGAIVFSDKAKLKELQAIVWPEIRSILSNRLAEERSTGTKTIVVEAAVMLEAGWQDIVDTLWIARVPQETAVQRLMTRNPLTEEQAVARITAQMTNEQRVSSVARAGRSYSVIDTDATLEQVELEVDQLFAQLGH